MLNLATIQETAQRVATASHAASRVIVFGSYGRGDADEGSDLDLLVIERELPDPAGEYRRLHKAVDHLNVGVDVLMCTEYEFARRSQVPGTLHYWAAKEGRVVYENAALLACRAEDEPPAPVGKEKEDAMPPHIEEALRLMQIAQRDVGTLELLLPFPQADLAAIGFNAQQAVEKALKAVCALCHIEFPRTHELHKLAGLLQNAGVNVPITAEHLGQLNPFAVEIRYDHLLPLTLTRDEIKTVVDKIMLWAKLMIDEHGNEQQ